MSECVCTIHFALGEQNCVCMYTADVFGANIAH